MTRVNPIPSPLAAPSRGFSAPAPKPHDKPLGALKLLLTLRRNVLEVWSKADFELPIQTRRTIVDTRVLLSDPVGIRRVLLENARNYPKNELQLRLLRPALGAGLVTSNGEDWRRQRRILAPLFSPQQVHSFNAAKVRVAGHAVERLARSLHEHEHEQDVVEMSDEMGRLTLEMLEHTLFSQGLAREPSEFQRAIAGYFTTFGKLDVFDLLGFPDFVPRLNRLRGRATLKFSARVVDEIVANRRRLLSCGADTPHDILALLLKAQDPDTEQRISEKELRDNIVTFIGAGHETTANALTWTLYLLSQAPDWRARVEAEIDAHFDAENPVASLPVTRAVLEETLRLYPPISMMSRLAVHDDVVAGTPVRAGTIVTMAPYVLHRHRTLWDDPDIFDPARFLGENRNGIDRYAYLPFGAGPRVCVGMGFAMAEMLVILGHYLRAFRFDLLPGHPVEPQVHITTRPAHGMKMRITRR